MAQHKWKRVPIPASLWEEVFGFISKKDSIYTSISSYVRHAIKEKLSRDKAHNILSKELEQVAEVES